MPRKEVEPRYCKNCNQYLKRGMATPTKYNKRAYCDNACRYAKNARIPTERKTKNKMHMSKRAVKFLESKWNQ